MTNLERLKFNNKHDYKDIEYSIFLKENNLNSSENYIKVYN